MHFKPGRVISQQRISGRVRLVKAVTRELLHQVKHFVGFFFRQAVNAGTLAKYFAVGRHLFFIFFTHCTAQHVGSTERVTTQNLRGLHHLFLVNHDAVGFFQHRLDAWVRVFRHLFALFTGNVGRNQVHRTRSVQRIHRNQIFQAIGPGVFEHSLHADTFKLENSFGFTFCKQPVNPRIVERQVLKLEVFLRWMACHDELSGNLQNGQRSQPQKVELDEANRLHIVFVKLAHRRAAAGLQVQGAKISQLAWCDQHPSGVHANVARQAFKLAGQCQQRVHVFFFALALCQDGFGLQRIHQLVIFFAVSRYQLQGHGLAWFIGNQF